MFDKKKDPKPSEPETQSKEKEFIQPTPKPTVSTVTVASKEAKIGPTISIKGDVSGDEDLLIEGTVEGNINLDSKDLTIGQTGCVYANIRAKEIKIEGEVQGDISGNEKVIISKTGKVQGNIIAPRVTLEDGANFKGSIDMDPNGQSITEPSFKSNNSSNKINKTPIDLNQTTTEIDDLDKFTADLDKVTVDVDDLDKFTADLNNVTADIDDLDKFTADLNKATDELLEETSA